MSSKRACTRTDSEEEELEEDDDTEDDESDDQIMNPDVTAGNVNCINNDIETFTNIGVIHEDLMELFQEAYDCLYNSDSEYESAEDRDDC